MSQAGAGHWDAYYRRLREAGADLDWRGRWTEPFVPLLRAAGARTVLELGCGTGNDALRLSGAGFEVTALDVSQEAIDQARAKAAPGVTYVVADVAEGLPFAPSTFDAVMANVALHMFSDAVTRAIFADVGRVVRPGGLFLLHVNAHDDRPLRARRRAVVRELEPDYVLEEGGQAVRFFPREYLLELLAGWEVVELEHVEIRDRETGEPFKRVWRAAARRTA